ncbi:type II toxin-antitoxin system VapC family toxin [Euzebya sp.]|uniref:type II toxin-antitoxin system VapC family toxin n=1 Tax=Euzebya sp. TaxID=1971409 RepID=UPI0035191100
MIVVDTAALIEYFTSAADDAMRLRDRITGVPLAAPHGLDLEVISGLRGLVLGGKVSPEDGRRALLLMEQLDLRRYDIAPLTDRIWQLRDNMWPYDAAFVALAEVLDVPLVTVDAKFARTPGLRCQVEVVA